MDFYGEVRGAD